MLTPIFIKIGSLVLSNTLHNLFTFMGPPRVDLWAYQNKTMPKTCPTIQTMLTPIFIKIGSLVFANTLQNLCINKRTDGRTDAHLEKRIF